MVGASVATRPMIGETMLRFEGGKIVNAAAKALQHPVDDHLVDIGGCRRKGAGNREARSRHREQHPCRNDPGERARERDHDDFGDQIGGLHPGDFIRAGRQTGLDFGQ
jgi:hypothetical protein